MLIANFCLSTVIGLICILIVSRIINTSINWIYWGFGIIFGIAVGVFFSFIFIIIFGVGVSIARGMTGIVLCLDVGLAAALLVGTVLGISDINNFQLMTPNTTASIIMVGITCGLAVAITVALAISGFIGFIVGLVFGGCTSLVFILMFSFVINGINNFEQNNTILLIKSIGFGLGVGLAATGVAATEINFARSVMVSSAISVAVGVAIMIYQPFENGIVASFAAFLGALRIFPFLVPIHLISLILYTLNFKVKHPVEWDELLTIPLPQTKQVLIRQLENNNFDTLIYLSCNPFQRSLVQRCLKIYLEQQLNPLHFIYTILKSPLANTYIFAPITKKGWENNLAFKNLFLGILSNQKVECTQDSTNQLIENIAYYLTYYLYDHTSTSLIHFVELLYQLLDKDVVNHLNFNLFHYRQNYTAISDYQGGTEIEITFDLMASFLSYQQLSDFTESVEKVINLPSSEAAIRPTLIIALNQLINIKNEINTYLNSVIWR